MSWTRGCPSLLGILLVGCTSVEIAEQDAFDVKRTVSERLLDLLGVTRTERRVEVGDGVELSTWWLDRPVARGVLLYFGGNGYVMVNGHHILQGILRSPVDVFTQDYRGYGESDGEPSVAAMKADALRIYDYLRDDLGVDAEHLVVQGQSLGSFVALWVASQRPVAGVILETPVTNVEDLLGHLAPWWTRAFIHFDVDPALKSEDNLARIAGLEVPTLIIAGEGDPIAHPDMARALFERAPGADKQLEVLAGGRHNDLPPRDDYQRVHRTFLERVLPAPAGTSAGL